MAASKATITRAIVERRNPLVRTVPEKVGVGSVGSDSVSAVCFDPHSSQNLLSLSISAPHRLQNIVRLFFDKFGSALFAEIAIARNLGSTFLAIHSRIRRYRG